MSSRLKVLYICLLSTLFVSCKHKETQVQQHLKEFIGNEIIIPDSLLIFNNGDTITAKSILSSRCKLVIFIDSSSCSTCRIKTLLFKGSFIYDFVRENCNIMVVFDMKDIYYLEVAFQKYGLKIPFFVDLKSEFKKYNKIPKEEILRIFLLYDNKVILAGDPMNNRALQRLYKKQILRLTKEE